MRTTVSLPESLLHDAKKRAAKRGVTLSAVVEDALRKEFAKDQTAPDKQFQLYTVRGKLVQPDPDLDRTSALLVADDEADSAGGKR